MRIPKTEHPPIIRVDFSNDVVWDEVCRATCEPVGEFLANVDRLEDVRFKDMTIDDLVAAIPKKYQHAVVFIVDRVTIESQEHTLLAVDVADNRGDSFRVIPHAVWSVENNLSVANVLFSEFADDVGVDTVFRGVQSDAHADGVLRRHDIARLHIQEIADPESGASALGRKLVKAGAVSDLHVTADNCLLWGTCKQGSRAFTPALMVDGDDINSSCTCRDGTACGHVSALLFAYQRQPQGCAVVGMPGGLIEISARPPSPGVFGFALRLLAQCPDAMVLQALLSGLDDRRTMRAAGQALAHSRHPEVVSAMLERLAQAELDAYSSSKSKKRSVHKSTHDEVGEEILLAFASMNDPRIAAAALPLISSFGEIACKAALPSADGGQLAAIADLLMGKTPVLFSYASIAASRLGPEESFRRLSAAFFAPDRDTDIGRTRMQAVSMRLYNAPDARWSDIGLSLIDGPAALYSIPVLGFLHEQRAVAPLLARLASEKDQSIIAVMIGALGRIGGRDAIDALLSMMFHGQFAVSQAARIAIEGIRDPDIILAIRAKLATLTPEGEEFRTLQATMARSSHDIHGS